MFLNKFEGVGKKTPLPIKLTWNADTDWEACIGGVVAVPTTVDINATINIQVPEVKKVVVVEKVVVKVGGD